MPAPMHPARAAALRAKYRRLFGASGGDRIAYQYARSMLSFGDGPACECQVRAWFEALEEYSEEAAEGCWLALGVSRLAMERAELQHLVELARHRALLPSEDAERTRLQIALALN